MSRKRRILLVLERDEDRKTAARVLGDAGFAVHVRSSPIGATVEIVRSDIDAVVIDIDIDVMSGDRFASLVRKNDRLDHVALVLSSKHGAEEADRVAREVGADAGIDRKRMAATVLAAVQRALGRIGARASQPPPPPSSCVLLLRTDRYALPLQEGRQLIGRDPECRFVLNHASVSRQHAAIEVRGVHARIEDLGSRNGTLVNGEVIDGTRDLDIGDVIEIGDETLVLAVKTMVSRETAQIDEESL